MAAGDFALFMILLVGLMPALDGFDLNELPDMPPEEMQRPCVEKSSSVKRQTRNKCLTKAQIAKLNELQEKVDELFKRLSICDDENFDIDKIELPKSWSKEPEVMMALKRVAGKKLIRKKDIDRYRRIMTNCNQISRIFEERAAKEKAARENNSPMRDFSGGRNYDSAKLHRLMGISPLIDLKNRFTNWSTKSHEAPEISKEQGTSKFPRSPPRSLSFGGRHNRSPIRLRPLKISPIREEEPPAFFKFL